jgi:hypothetical protein
VNVNLDAFTRGFQCVTQPGTDRMRERDVRDNAFAKES